MDDTNFNLVTTVSGLQRVVKHRTDTWADKGIKRLFSSVPYKDKVSSWVKKNTFSPCASKRRAEFREQDEYHTYTKNEEILPNRKITQITTTTVKHISYMSATSSTYNRSKERLHNKKRLVKHKSKNRSRSSSSSEVNEEYNHSRNGLSDRFAHRRPHKILNSISPQKKVAYFDNVSSDDSSSDVLSKEYRNKSFDMPDKHCLRPAQKCHTNAHKYDKNHSIAKYKKKIPITTIKFVVTGNTPTKRSKKRKYRVTPYAILKLKSIMKSPKEDLLNINASRSSEKVVSNLPLVISGSAIKKQIENSNRIKRRILDFSSDSESESDITKQCTKIFSIDTSKTDYSTNAVKEKIPATNKKSDFSSLATKCTVNKIPADQQKTNKLTDILVMGDSSNQIRYPDNNQFNFKNMNPKVVIKVFDTVSTRKQNENLNNVKKPTVKKKIKKDESTTNVERKVATDKTKKNHSEHSLQEKTKDKPRNIKKQTHMTNIASGMSSEKISIAEEDKSNEPKTYLKPKLATDKISETDHLFLKPSSLPVRSLSSVNMSGTYTGKENENAKFSDKLIKNTSVITAENNVESLRTLKNPNTSSADKSSSNSKSLTNHKSSSDNKSKTDHKPSTDKRSESINTVPENDQKISLATEKKSLADYKSSSDKRSLSIKLSADNKSSTNHKTSTVKRSELINTLIENDRNTSPAAEKKSSADYKSSSDKRWLRSKSSADNKSSSDRRSLRSKSFADNKSSSKHKSSTVERSDLADTKSVASHNSSSSNKSISYKKSALISEHILNTLSAGQKSSTDNRCESINTIIENDQNNSSAIKKTSLVDHKSSFDKKSKTSHTSSAFNTKSSTPKSSSDKKSESTHEYYEVEPNSSSSINKKMSTNHKSSSDKNSTTQPSDKKSSFSTETEISLEKISKSHVKPTSHKIATRAMEDQNTGTLTSNKTTQSTKSSSHKTMQSIKVSSHKIASTEQKSSTNKADKQTSISNINTASTQKPSLNMPKSTLDINSNSHHQCAEINSSTSQLQQLSSNSTLLSQENINGSTSQLNKDSILLDISNLHNLTGKRIVYAPSIKNSFNSTTHSLNVSKASNKNNGPKKNGIVLYDPKQNTTLINSFSSTIVDPEDTFTLSKQEIVDRLDMGERRKQQLFGSDYDTIFVLNKNAQYKYIIPDNGYALDSDDSDCDFLDIQAYRGYIEELLI